MQINRLFEIIYILLDRSTVTAKELSEHFEVSIRTIYRDIECLSGAGIPVFMTKGKGGGISLLPDFILNKTVLTEKEKGHILSSLKALKSVNLTEDDTVIKKMGSFLGNQNSDWIEINFSSWSNEIKDKEKINMIKESVLNKYLISFSYFSSKGECTIRLVEPLKLCFKGQNWYVYGYCREREDYRFFKLIRMKELKVLDEIFHRIAPEEIFSNVSKTYKLEPITLKLKISSQMAHRVYDEFEEVNFLEDGSFLVKIQFPNEIWVYDYILSFGEFCEVLEPAVIRQKLSEKLKSMLSYYL